MQRYLNRPQHLGLSLIEISLGLALTTGLVLAVYQGSSSLGLTGAEAIGKNQAELARNQALEEINQKLRNIVPLKLSMGSALENMSPLACGEEAIASGLIPLPGHTKAMIDAYTQPTLLDPSLSTWTSGESPNDAIRFAYYSPGSAIYNLAINSATNLPYPTANVATITLAGATFDLVKGDFALISDSASSDIFRITELYSDANDNTILEHSPTVSIWNKAWSANYGVSGPSALAGGAQVQKVQLVTYALDPNAEILYQDTHEHDDGFNPLTKAFASPLSLAKNWRPHLSEASGFSINYSVIDDNDLALSTTTRSPRAGEYNEANQTGFSTCGNQLGKPYLLSIDVDIRVSEKQYEYSVSPSSIIMGSGSGSSLEDQPPVRIYGTGYNAPNGVPPPCSPPCTNGGNF